MARLGRQLRDEFGDRLARHDLVMRAVHQQQRHVEPRRRLERRIHQIDEPVDRIDPGSLDDQRVARHLPQHRDIVGDADPSPRPVSTVSGNSRTAANSASLGSKSIVARPHTAGALRITPSASALGMPRVRR